MKQDDTTLFQALQDPLFTLIALVLINTLWIIIPGGRGPAGEPPPKDIRGQLTDLVVETRQLEGQVQGIEQAIHTEEMNVASLTDQGSLQEEEEKKLIDNLEGRIQRLKDEALKKRQAQLSSSDSELGTVYRETENEKKRVEDLRSEKTSLAEFVKSRKGAAVYSTEGTQGKRPLYFELDHNKLYALNEDNYEIQQEALYTGKNYVPRQVLVRKKAAIGQSFDEIDEPDGDLHRKLMESSPNNYYVIFWARSDSFELFLKARFKAEQDGYSVGWHPFPRMGVLTPNQDAKAEEIVRKK